MKLFRTATFAISVALMLLGHSATATMNSHPEFSVTEDRILSLRETISQLVVDTIEDAIRQGGLALFGEDFRIDSSLSWVSEESSDVALEGEVDAVFPFYEEGEHVIFTQPGLVFWKGQEEEGRVDGNFGVVYRTNLASTPVGIDAIGGASLFYDWDFHRVGHSRLGIGADIQSGIFHGAFNYYHPLSGGRDGQREGFIEKALRGMDLRFALERDTVRAGARLGYWRYDGGEDVTDEWRTSVGFDAGFRIVPGVFIEAEWEKHKEDLILDQRLNLGLAFRFSLPDFEGQSYSGGGMPTDLYRVVDREKRILYEERKEVPRVQVDVEDGAPVSEGDTVTISGELAELAVPVMLELVIDEDTSLAEFGSDKDFTYGYKVYEPDANTGEQSASNAINCPNTRCRMAIPAGITKFDIEMDILADSDDKEFLEEIILRIDVPEEYQRVVRGAEITVTIRAHGNEVAFASDAVTMLAENNETEGIEVPVSINRPSPTPITLSVAMSGTAVAGEDYRVSDTGMAIPANVSSASLTLWGIDNEDDEENKSIVLTLSGDLPDGWTLGAQTTHTVTLLDNESFIGFAVSNDVVNPARVFEDVGTVSLKVVSDAPLPAEGAILAWSASPSGSLMGTSSGTLTLNQGDGEGTFTVSINDDGTAEEDEQVTVVLTATSLPTDWNLGDYEHVIAIEPGDGTLQFASSFTNMTVDEGRTVNVNLSSDIDTPRGGLPITISVSPQAGSASASDVSFTENQMIPGGQKSYDFDIEVVDDGIGEQQEVFEISVVAGANFPATWGTVSTDTRSITVRPYGINSVGFEQTQLSLNERSTGYDVKLRLKTPTGTSITSLDEDLPFDITLASGTNENDITFTPFQTVDANATVSDDGIVTITTITINNDPIDEDEEIFSLRLGEGANFPSNWEIEEVGRLLRITVPKHLTQRTVRFANANSSALEGGDPVTTQLLISPPLQSDVTIPIRILGPDNYLVKATAPPSARAPREKEYDDIPGLTSFYRSSLVMVTFAQSEDAESVTLELDPIRNGLRQDSTIRFVFLNLPASFRAGNPREWRVVIDNID